MPPKISPKAIATKTSTVTKTSTMTPEKLTQKAAGYLLAAANAAKRENKK